MNPSLDTLKRLVLYSVHYYNFTQQSGATPIEINWMLGQENEAVEEIASVLELLKEENLIGIREGLYYCIDLHGLDKEKKQSLDDS